MENRYTQLMSVEVDYDLIGCDVEFVKALIRKTITIPVKQALH